MNSFRLVISVFVLTIVLSSCKFSCNIGAIDEDKPTGNTRGPVRVGDGIVYNGIQISSEDIQLNKAYLVFENGEKVPDDNIVDFTSPIELIIRIDSGWTANNNKVMLGASEKVIDEDGNVMLDEKDLFTRYSGGITKEDAKIIALKAAIRLRKGAPPTSFTVSTRVWDKNSNAYIEAKYKLYSK